jgi:hypothetical protein
MKVPERQEHVERIQQRSKSSNGIAYWSRASSPATSDASRQRFSYSHYEPLDKHHTKRPDDREQRAMPEADRDFLQPSAEPASQSVLRVARAAARDFITP